MRFLWCLLLCCMAGGAVAAQDNADVAPVPIPKLDADGPTSFVTALAFSPDGQSLYAAGWDKIIRVWRRDAKGQFQLDAGATFRVPIGPGPAGKLNALAVSPDGRWLATGGNAAFRHGSTFDRPGLIVPAMGSMDREMREDQGTIYLFDTHTRDVRQLRGHQGSIVALEFAGAKPAILASAGEEWDERAGAKQGGLRLWNVADGKLLAAVGGLPEPRARPALAIVEPAVSNRASKLPNIAAAWGDERLRVWNPNTGQLSTTNDARYNNTLAQVPGLALTSGSAAGLKTWRIAETATVRSQLEQTLGSSIPRAMATASSDSTAKFDSLAVVAREPGSEQDRLYLVDPRSGRLLGQPANLWNGRGVQPALAASAAGELAVTGGRGPSIVIYRTADLRRNRAAPQQTLDSSGETVRVVSIARNGDRYGLVLSPTPKERPGQVRTQVLERDRIFDATAAEFVGERRGWSLDALDGAGWTARHDVRTSGGQQRIVLSISQSGRPASQIELEPRQQLNDYALLPPRAPENRPLLAIAYFDFESGQPVLALFDAASGERVRELLGHSGRVTSVAFSRDGRLLATAADDQTACIWTLADLDQVLGVRGQLQGLKVDAGRGDGKPAQLLVAEADRTLIAAGVTAGDVLQGIVADGLVEPFDTPRAFYQAISLVKPGTTISLRLLRGADRRDARVVIGQGVDERKPLVTFFTRRVGAQAALQWIGWSPLGPFESSGPAVEKLLGWHFNTGQAEAPVSFAFVDQYRDRFATPGLLRKLLETGRPQLPPKREPPAPTMSLWLDQPGQPPLALEPGSSSVVHHAPAAFEASTGPLLADEIESIDWRIDGESGTFELADRQWRATLKGITWNRGSYPVEVLLRTKPPLRELKQVLSLVYQPAPPKLESKLPRRIETANEQFEFQAKVTPAGGVPVRARLTHEHAQEAPAVVRETTTSEPWIVRETVRLRPGLNRLKLQAENDQAMAERQANERATASFDVYYNPPKAVPVVRIELNEVVVHSTDGPEKAFQLASDDAIVVHAPRVALRGKLQGSSELSIAQFRLDSEATPRVLDKFVASERNEFAFEQALSLRPGVNRLMLESQSANSEMTHRRLTLDFRPALPALTLRPLPQLVFVEPLTVVADILPAEDRQPYQVEALLNGKQLPAEKVLADEEQIRVVCGLRSGDNRLELRLRNQWGTEPVVQTLAVEYVRPPKILSLASERQTAPEAVLIRLRVESERRPTAAVIHINGQPRRGEIEIKESRDAGQWEAALEPLPLEPGENRIQVAVEDEHSQSETKELVINVEKRFEATPQIVVLSAHDHPVLPDSPVPVQVVVRSESPIQKLLIEGSGADGSAQVLHSADDLVARPRKNAHGLYEYYLNTVLRSANDPQQWQIEAVNRGGRNTVEVPSAVIVPPASVFLESVALKSQPAQQYQLAQGKTGQLVLTQELGDSTIILSGYVVSSQAAQMRQLPVHVWANGFLQKPALAGPPQKGSSRRPFQAELVLSQSRNNLIEVGIVDPDLPGDAANRTALVLNCAKPNTARKLHLLIVAVGAKHDEASLVRKRAVEALQGTLKSASEFTTPAFEQGIIHAVLLGNTVQRNKVLFEVGRLARNVQPNDVAMIYYQGNVREADNTFYLTTSATKALARPAQTEISRDELNRWAGVLAGAQLILLDVDRAASAQPSAPARHSVSARWPADSRIAFFRFAWAAPEPANTPDEPVLLLALEQAVEQGNTLSRIDSGLESFSTRAADRYPAGLVYERHLPSMLGKLEFAPESDGP